MSPLGSNIFNADYEACSKATHAYMDTSSPAISLSGFSGVVSTTDGNQVTSAPIAMVIKANTMGSGFVSLTLNVSFLPSCNYSPILGTTSIGGHLSIVVDSKYSFAYINSNYRHTFEEYWDTQGFTNVCTVSFELYGAGASFSSINGNNVDIEPVLGTATIGESELGMTARYTASAHDPAPPSGV